MKDQAVCVLPTGTFRRDKQWVEGPLVTVTRIGSDIFSQQKYQSPQHVYFAPLISNSSLGFTKITDNFYLSSQSPAAHFVQRMRRTY